MKRSTAQALALDALHQVLDNSVFRILTDLTLVPILLTFVLGAREEGLVLLFGLKTWAYADLPLVGPMLATTPDPQGVVIQSLLSLFLDQAAGNLGMLLAIVATAFFVPRLLEKGAADLYFHKPASRSALYLSRFCAGLLFIALSSAVLSLGVFLGLALSSQHVDPGVLLACPTLVYLFALVFPFTMLVGVVTRSTVASILLSALFFLFNGCIQQAWISVEQLEHGPNLAALVGRGASDEEATDENGGEDGDEEGRRGARDSAFGRALLGTLDAARVVLPKTSDADHLARKARSSLSPPFFRDESEHVIVSRLPGGLAPRSGPEAPPPPELRARLGTLRLAALGDEAGAPATEFTLWSRPIVRSTSTVNGRERERVETLSQAGEALEDELAALGLEPTRMKLRLGELDASRVSWNASEPTPAGCVAWCFKGSEGELLFTLLVRVPGQPDDATLERESQRLARYLVLDRTAIDAWYPQQLRFDAPWRTNILFSVGSSLAFAALVLALGCWRLRRIAF